MKPTNAMSEVTNHGVNRRSFFRRITGVVVVAAAHRAALQAASRPEPLVMNADYVDGLYWNHVIEVDELNAFRRSVMVNLLSRNTAGEIFDDAALDD